MERKVSARIQKKIDNIVQLKSALQSWENLSEDEVFKLVKEFEKTPRAEGSSFYNNHFNDSEFAHTLVGIANNYKDHSKMNLYAISALGNMMRRYDLPETTDIYQLMLDNAARKDVGPYVAIYLPKMELFKKHPNRWEYYLSIKKLSPKKLAETKFIEIIKDKLHDIPTEFKEEIISFLTSRVESANNEHSKNKFSQMISDIE